MTPEPPVPNASTTNAHGPDPRGPDPRRPSVVALGGGHGLATTIQAARLYAGELTAVVSVADDGGSSGRLRQIAGIPAPGDIRRCLVAMASSEAATLWPRAFEYRFPSGDLEGHALGNLLIAGLANVTGDFGQALELASELLRPVGRVLPATAVPVVLKAEVAGTEILGQSNVSASPGAISRVSIVPPDAPVPDKVLDAIAGADQIVIGPGSLFTSVLAVCAVPEIRAALAERAASPHAARVVYVCNLRPQPPETAGFTPADHLRTVVEHGVPVDVMVTNDPGVPEHLQDIAVVRARMGRSDGAGHSPARLAAVLRRLT